MAVVGMLTVFPTSDKYTQIMPRVQIMAKCRKIIKK
jgi:hypothetical protein